MRIFPAVRTALVYLMAGSAVWCQVRQAPPVMVEQPPPTTAQPAPARPAPPAPAPAQPKTTAPAQAATPGPQQPTGPSSATLTPSGGFLLQNVSLVELIDILAKRLKINYILDPRVKGSVTINTYGEVKPTDLMPLLETILRINGAAIVQVGDLYRIVPINTVSQLPIQPRVNGANLPDDERMILNLIFLKYATVAEMAKLLKPFLGEGAEVTAYDPANLLILLDNARNMRRTMELIGLFDNDSLAGQRVRLFDVTNGRPSDIVKELESVFKAYALSDKSSPVKFIPVDRINTIIAVAPNPGIFDQVKNWLEKLDVPVKVTKGSVDNYVYRLKYGRAETIAMAIMSLYTGMPMMGMFGGGMYGGMGAMGGMGGMYGGMGGMYGGMGGGMYGGMGGGMYGGGMYGGGMYGGMGGMYGGGSAYPPMIMSPSALTTPAMTAQGAPAVPGSVPAGTPDATGTYLGATGLPPGMQYQRIPHVIPNPFDNTLLVQGTPQEWEQISHLLQQLDVPPRQVLIEAKIYEVDMTGAFAAGVDAYLRNRNATGTNVPGGGLTRQLTGSSAGSALTLTAGLLVGHSRELLGVLTATESATHAKVVGAPTVIATDSIPATITVGQEVPTLSSQAVAGGLQQGGNSLFTNTISNRSTGVTLNIVARVNSSGIVTMVINQEVSAPIPPPTGVTIQSPSFSKRNVQTQVTVADGDTISIGGIMQESETLTTGGIPVLHKIPYLGAAFGSQNRSKAKTELIIFLTPRVIYDTSQIADATDELKSGMKKLRKLIEE